MACYVFLSSVNFEVGVAKPPNVSRLDGGHLVIWPKESVEHRWELGVERAGELMELSMLVGEAMMMGLAKNGIELLRINFQDNGNWALARHKEPRMHLHLYGRAKSEELQQVGEALYFPSNSEEFYADLDPLNDEDVRCVLVEVERLRGKYEGLRVEVVS